MLGSSRSRVESARLEPEQGRQLLVRAETEETTASELIRRALRRYLTAA
jgi:hypothetical protein